MRHFRNKSGFTLTELLVVMAVILMLVAAAVPTGKQLMKSFESTAGVRSVIEAALANARAIAAREQCYAGVRFQQNLKGRQYIVFICHDPAAAPSQLDLTADPFITGTGLAGGFRAVEGRKPIPLPETVGVMDLRIRLNPLDPTISTDMPIEDVVGNDDTVGDGNIDEDFELMDTTTFSIVFSPAGKLVIHDVRIRNRTGRINSSGDVMDPLFNPDDVFNTIDNVDKGNAMFYQDDYAHMGLGQEMSRNCFVVYDKKEFGRVDIRDRWSLYLKDLDLIYVNPHTGEIVNK